MTSATWPPDVRRLATKYMVDPATVFVGKIFFNGVSMAQF